MVLGSPDDLKIKDDPISLGDLWDTASMYDYTSETSETLSSSDTFSSTIPDHTDLFYSTILFDK